MNIVLINEIAKDLDIIRESYEDEASWRYRVKYSALGLQMLSCLYDKNDDINEEDEVIGTVSHQHVTNRAKNLVEIFDMGETDIDKIVELYKQTGYMLHKRNRLTYPKSTFSRVGNICLARGVHPSSATSASGIGMVTKSNGSNEITLVEMFNLSTANIQKWFATLEKSLKNWKTSQVADDLEYLNIKESGNKGYWSGQVPKNGQTTLCRTNDRLNYWIVKHTANGTKYSLLPEWRTRGGEYYRIAIALRCLFGNPPKVQIKQHNGTAILLYDYLLPPAEQNFIEVYSWRANMNDGDYVQRLHRIVRIELLPAIAELFTTMGYIIEEE